MSLLYQQLAADIEKLIREGVFRDGERLPGVRALSRQFRVSVSTVLQAHQLLEARGLVCARERSGYYACLNHGAEMLSVRTSRPRKVAVSDMDLTLELCSREDSDEVPLGGAIPHASLLPVRQIQQALLWAARQSNDLVEYAFPGKEPLRRQLAQRMANIGVVCSTEDILVTNGAQEAILLALRALTRPGDIVAVEAPSFPGVLQALSLRGLKAIEIPSRKGEGISLEALEMALDQWPVKACIVVTNHSNPLGNRMSDERKKALVRMLEAASVPLIEDDIYGDLGHDGERPRPAKVFDRTGNVIYCSSFSKTVLPSLRIGWVVPGKHHDLVSKHKYFSNLATASLPQLAVAHFLEQGSYDRALRQVRPIYRTLCQQFRDAILRYFPEGTIVSDPVGGFVLWVELPESISGKDLAMRARDRGIHVAPGRIFSVSGRFDHCLRINAANPWTRQVEDALKTLGELALESVPEAPSLTIPEPA